MSSIRILGPALALLAHVAGAWAQDADRDGLPDAEELAGVPGEPLLDLPRMGADPTVPDLMVQADWYTCDPIVEYCGPNSSFDQHQLSAEAAHRLAAYFAPDVRVHVDNAVAPRDPADRVHGAWGGAHRWTTSPPCSSDVLGARYGTFHHVITGPIGGGGSGYLYSYCASSDSVRMGVLAQELGHNFGLQHGGNTPSYPANCKPHYRSPMNYGYTYDRTLAQFSRGQRTVVLNPTRMDERLGLGTTDPVALAALRAEWGFFVDDAGAVDWNRDGVIQSEPVRAAPTWGFASCEQSTAHSDFFTGPDRHPALAWLPDTAAPRLYLVSRRPEDGRVVVRYATHFDQCVWEEEIQSCTDWSPGKTEPARELPMADRGDGAPAVAGWRDDAGRGHLLVVHAIETGQLVGQQLDLDASLNEVWSAPEVVVDEPLLGDPSMAVADEGSIALVVPTAGGLLRRDHGAAGWSPARYEAWSDGSPIEPCGGVGLAYGGQLYAAIPTGPSCRLAFAVDEGGAWRELPEESVWAGGDAPHAAGRPALAFVPLPDGGGRFYLAWRPFPEGAIVISMSQGDDPDPTATARRLRFLGPVYLRNVWALLLDGPALEYDARYDQNLRAAWVYANSGGLQVNPFADGVLDVGMRDQDDYAYIKAHLACSLTVSCSQPSASGGEARRDFERGAAERGGAPSRREREGSR